jgi:hypothetical protein
MECVGCAVEIDPGNACLEIVGEVHRLYCLTCRPPGRGYSISDLQAIRAETQIQRDVARLSRELRVVEAGGADILGLFH